MSETDSYYVRCNDCNWSVTVEEGALKKDTHPEVSAKSRARGHTGVTDCDYEHVDIEKVNDG